METWHTGDIRPLRFVMLLCMAWAANVTGRAQTITPSVPQGCYPNGNQITFTLSGVSAPCTATWNIEPIGGGSPNSYQACPAFVTTLGIGCYNVSVTYGGNVIPYDQNPFCVHPRPQPSFTASLSTVCPGACVDFEDTSDPGSAGASIATWQWNTGIPGCTPGNTGSFTCCMPGTSGGSTFIPTLEVTADNGCPSIGLFQLPISVENDPPTASFSGVLLDCGPSLDIPYNGSGSYTSAATQPLAYSWTIDPNQAISAPDEANMEVTFPGTGVFDLCLAVENAYGCKDTLCQEVVIFDQPDVVLDYPPTTCAGSIPLSAAGTQPASPSLVEWDMECDGTVDFTGMSWNAALTDVGPHDICVHIAYPSCSTDEQITVEVLPGIEAGFTPGDTAACSYPFHLDFSNTSTGTDLSHNWTVSGPETGSASTPDFSFDFNSPGTYTVTLAISNPYGCSDTHTTTVTVAPPVIDPFHVIPASACAGDPITADFDVNILPGQTIVNYHWDFGDGNTMDLPDDTPPTWTYGPGSNPLPPNNYTVTLTITTASGCTATSTAVVAIVPILDPAFGPTPQVGCIGQTVTFCADDNTGTSYQWDLGNGCYILTEDTCVSYTYRDVDFSQGPVVCFNVTLTIYNQNCDTSLVIPQAVCIWGPMAGFTVQQECSTPFQVDFTSTSYAADSLWWNFGDGTFLGGDANDPAIQAPTHVYGAEGAYTACLTAVADTSVCPHSACMPIIIDEPGASLSMAPTEGCSPLCVTFSPDNEPFIAEWTVSFGNGDTLHVAEDETHGCYFDYYTDYATFSDTVCYADMGTYTVTATTKNAHGCTASVTYPDVIEVLTPGNVAEFTYTVDAICPEVLITCTPIYGLDSARWSYRYPTNGPWTEGTPDASGNLHLTLPLGAQLVMVELEGDQGNCSNTWTSILVAPAASDLYLSTSNTDPCPGDEVNFSALPSGEWSDFSWTGLAPPPPGLPDVSGSFPANGDYTVCVSGVNTQYGCLDTACVVLNVLKPGPEVAVQASKDPVYCTYDVCVTDTSDCPGCTYQWTFTDQVTNISSTPCPDLPNCCQAFAPSIINATLTATAPNGCSTTVVIPDILGLGNVIGPWTQDEDSVACAPYCVTFTAFNTALQGYTYSWDFNDPCDGAGGPGAVAQHCYTCAGVFCPSMALTDPDGCVVIVNCEEPIVVQEYHVQVSYDPVICAGDTSIAQFTPGAPFGLQSVSFQPGGSTAAVDPPYTHALFPAESTSYVAVSTYAQCTDRDTLVVQVNLPPMLVPDPFGPFCLNDDALDPPVINTASTGTGSWNWPAAWPQPMGLGSGSHSVSYSFTDTLGCSSTITVPFTIHDTTAVVLAPMEACIDAAPFSLMPFVDHAGGTFFAQYMPGIWSELPVQFRAQDIQDPPATVFSVPIRYTYVDNHGCTSINEAALQVHPLPVPAFSAPDLCAADTLVVTNGSTIPSGTIDGWQWQMSGQGNSTAYEPPPQPCPNAGEVTISLTATSDHGCLATVADTVQVHALPVLTAAPFGPFCLNDGPLPNPVVGTTNPAEAEVWTWPGNTNVAIEIGAGPGSVGYVLTDVNGCKAAIEVPFMINDTTAVTFDPISACTDTDPIQLEDHASLPGGTFLAQYQPGSTVWITLADGLFDPAYINPLPLAEQAFPVRYAYTNAMGCTSRNDTQVLLYPLPQPAFVSADACAYDPLPITDASTIGSGAITGWHWEVTGQGSLTGQVLPPLLFNGPDTVNIALTTVSDQGCVSTATGTVLVHPVPVAAFASADACQYQDVVYANASTLAWPGILSMDWRFGDGSTTTGNDPVHQWDAWGAFTDTLIVSSEFGCRDTATVGLTIHPAPVNIIELAPNCFGLPSTVSSASSIPLGTISATWWDMEGNTYMGPTATHLFSGAGFWPVTLYTESDMGCIAELTGAMEIWPLPHVSCMLDQSELCQLDSVQFTDSSVIPAPYANADWQWWINGTWIGSGTHQTVIFTDPGQFDVSLIVTSANGCVDSLTQTAQVLVHPLPVAGFQATPRHTSILQPMVQFTDQSQGAVYWTYNFGDDQFSHAPNPVHLYGSFGTFDVLQTVVNEFDCMDTAWQRIVVDPEPLVYVPNAFTPDKDGLNDVFKPSLDGFAIWEYELTIWDRWGEMIFETTDPGAAWDGMYGDSPVQNGVYVWQIKLRAEGFLVNEVMRGHVTVVR